MRLDGLKGIRGQSGIVIVRFEPENMSQCPFEIGLQHSDAPGDGWRVYLASMEAQPRLLYLYVPTSSTGHGEYAGSNPLGEL